MRVRLWCDRGSDGLINLKNALIEAGVDCKRIKKNSQTYSPRADHLIINWGNGSTGYNSTLMQRVASSRVEPLILNQCDVVTIASNKLKTFRELEDRVSIPIFYTYKHDELESLIREGKKIYCRTKLSGHSGEGIVVARTVEELVDAPLYTVGVDVKGEYRVHVFKRRQAAEYQVIDIVKKRRRTELHEQEEGINYDVRNLSGGWVYCHNNLDNISPNISTLAIQAVSALGLDFGAVDIIEEKRTGNFYVLEVNSAPGLSSPTTIAAYTAAIKEMLV